MPVSPSRRTVPGLAAMAHAGEKIAMLTCYDASFAALLDRAGVDVMLIGDSLGMVIGGHASTLPVTLDDMVYHTRCVTTAAKTALVVADLSFGSYQTSPQQATVEFLVARGIPVCGHLGLQPQSVHSLGGYKVQGKTDESAQQLRDDARLLVNAGAALLVLEMVPAALATALTAELAVPTIGIGAGPGCSGQVLVLYDMLGIYPGKPMRFVRNFMTGSNSIEAAVAAYVQAVKDGSFPGPEHCM